MPLATLPCSISINACSGSAVHNYCARGTPAQPASTFGSGPMNQRSTFYIHYWYELILIYCLLAATYLIGAELYNSLSKWLEDHLMKIRTVSIEMDYATFICEMGPLRSLPSIAIWAIHGRGSATVLYQAMGPLHDCCARGEQYLHVP